MQLPQIKITGRDGAGNKMLALVIQDAMTRAGLRSEIIADTPVDEKLVEKVRYRFHDALLTITTLDVDSPPSVARRVAEIQELRAAQESAQRLNKKQQELLADKEKLIGVLKCNSQYRAGYETGARNSYNAQASRHAQIRDEERRKADKSIGQYKSATRSLLRDLRSIIAEQQRTIDDLRGVSAANDATTTEMP